MPSSKSGAALYMREDGYEKNSTKYNKLANFYLNTKYSEEIFKKLLDSNSNRISISSEKYSLKNKYDNTQDHIYIRALYHCNELDTANLLISNDARRRIITLYKDRIFRKSYTERILSKISNKLGYSLHDKGLFNELLPALKKQRAFTAGSFPLQVYLEENWYGSDLDIFTFYHGSHSVLGSIIAKYAASHKKLSPDNIKDSHYIEFNEVHEYTLNNGFRIQLIETNRSSLESVLSNFDFDFCKIAYTFDTDRLVIHNRESILTRSCKFNLNLEKKHKCAERLQKYESRGFTVLNAKEMLEMEKMSREAKDIKMGRKGSNERGIKREKIPRSSLPEGTCTIEWDDEE